MNITLTQKETMLLQDQKSHEEICIEKYGLYSQQAKDDNLKQMLKGIEQAEKTHLDTINQLLAGTIPQMSGQSSQGNSQQNKMNPPARALNPPAALKTKAIALALTIKICARICWLRKNIFPAHMIQPCLNLKTARCGIF